MSPRAQPSPRSQGVVVLMKRREDGARAVAWARGDESVMFGSVVGGAPILSPGARAGRFPVARRSVSLLFSSLRSYVGWVRNTEGVNVIVLGAGIFGRAVPRSLDAIACPSTSLERPAHCAAPRHLPYSCPCACVPGRTVTLAAVGLRCLGLAHEAHASHATENKTNIEYSASRRRKDMHQNRLKVAGWSGGRHFDSLAVPWPFRARRWEKNRH